MINHTESTVRVFFSNDYGLFKMIAGNRELNERKINKIMDDIKAGIDVLKYYPIQVREHDGRLSILDGQHRFWIAKKLGRAVYYILLGEERSLYDIAAINSNTEKWKVRDFLNCYVNLENPHYKELDEFMKKYGLSATLCVKLLADGVPGYGAGGNDATETFQRGAFKVFARAQAHSLAEACANFNDFRYAKNANFFLAIHKIIAAGKVDIMEIVKKYNDHKDELIKQPSWKEYITNLENIYNKRRQSRTIIYE